MRQSVIIASCFALFVAIGPAMGQDLPGPDLPPLPGGLPELPGTGSGDPGTGTPDPSGGSNPPPPSGSPPSPGAPGTPPPSAAPNAPGMPGANPSKAPKQKPILQWAPSIEAALKSTKESRRPIVVYLHPRDESKPPRAFENERIAQASNETVVLIRRGFDEDGDLEQEHRLRAAPILLAFDPFMNFLFKVPGLPPPDQLVQAFSKASRESEALEATVRAKWNRAEKLLEDKQRTRAIRALVDVVRLGLKGYPQILESKARLDRMADEDLQAVDRIAAADPKEARKRLDAMIRNFRGTLPELRALLRTAELLHDSGQIAEAFKLVDKAEGSKDPDPSPMRKEIEGARGKFTRAGLDAVLSALENGLARGMSAARSELARLKETYDGTPVAAALEEALTDLGR